MRTMTLLALAALSGCAGVAEMRNDSLYATHVSSKASQVVAACISEGWSLQQLGGMFTPDVRILPISGGQQVMIYNPESMSPDAFADVIAKGEGSQVSYYAKHRDVFKRRFGDLIPDCL